MESVCQFADYASPVADVTASHGHGIQYHQYADDMQLHLAMRTDNTSAGLSVLAACTAEVRQWSGTCRTACSSTRTNQKHWSSERHISYVLRHQLCRPSLSPTSIWVSEWVSSVLRPHQHSIGYTGDGFYRSKDPTNSIKVLKESAASHKMKVLILDRRRKTRFSSCVIVQFPLPSHPPHPPSADDSTCTDACL